ncbi:MAG: acyl-CoA/acyl-ACP dehydrogenase, partial [Notoacmeibacter sp.]|nr:acyl-CoA/acyl-ACP dehydrogenase [Notoacmeibacter sp.]
MDFTLPPAVEDYRARIAAFVEREILPVEADRDNHDAHGNIGEAALAALRAKAKAEGLWALQVSREWGGQGFGKVGMAVCYEEMNRSI